MRRNLRSWVLALIGLVILGDVTKAEEAVIDEFTLRCEVRKRWVQGPVRIWEYSIQLFGPTGEEGRFFDWEMKGWASIDMVDENTITLRLGGTRDRQGVVDRAWITMVDRYTGEFTHSSGGGTGSYGGICKKEKYREPPERLL